MQVDFTVVAKAYGLKLHPEFRFHPKKRWRFDFALPEHKIAIEVEGGTWSNGRHTRGAGYRKDCEKYNAANVLGWHVLRYTTDMLRDDPEQPVRDAKNIISRGVI